MNLIIHRGTNQIGGTCVEVTSGASRIVIDMGMPLHAAAGSDFDERVLNNKTITELTKEKILPDIPGLYRGGAPAVDAILISHSHKDHYGFLSYLHPDIPVYMSKGAHEMIRALNEFLSGKNRITFSKPIYLNHKTATPMGGFSVTPYLVDHSAFAAMGFLIKEKSTGRALFYGGDFRDSGWTGGRCRSLMENPPKGVDCLLMEGTMLCRGPAKYASEKEVVSGVINAINKSANTVLPVYCSGQNIDRIVSLYKAARRTGSLLVIDAYTAYMLRIAGKMSPKIPQMDWRDILVFIASYENYTGKRGGDIYVGKIAEVGHKELLRPLGRAKIQPREFEKLDRKALFVMRNTMIPVVEKIRQMQNSTLIYSLWNGYVQKDSADSKRFWKFVKDKELKVEYIHTSGHAPVATLQKFAAALAPTTIIPIHTFEKAKYPALFKNVRLLDDGEVFEIN